MNFKKILVLVMTLAMLIATCAPALNAFAAEEENTIESALDHADNYVRENIDEAYAYAYDYISENGCLDNALVVLGNVIEALEVAAENEAVPAIVEEINATIATLEKIEALLVSGDANTLSGLVSGLEALEADLDAHIANLNNICDADSALATIDTVAKELVYAAAGFVFENLTVICDNAPVVTAKVVEALVLVHAYVGEYADEVAELVIETLEGALDLANGLYNGEEEAVEFASDFVMEIVDTVVEFNAENDNVLSEGFVEVFGITVEEGLELLAALCVENYDEAVEAYGEILGEILEVAEGELVKAIELYYAIMDIIADAHDNADEVVVVTSQIFSYVYDFVVENDIANDLSSHLDNLVNIIAATYGETNDVEAVAAEVYAYVVDMFADTFEGEYVLTIDSAYVALGNASYGEELAGMLHLSDKYTNLDLDADASKLAGADLITVRLDNDNLVEFVTKNLKTLGKDINWNAYLDDEGQKALDTLLASVKKGLIETGAAEELAPVISTLVSDSIEFVNVTVNATYVADLAAYALESTLYSYAKFLADLETVLANINTVAPEATVVITGVQSPLAGLDLGEYEALVDAAMTVFNTQLIAVAYANENVIYVDSADAADIYAALNVVCNHAYDDCEDETCNICGATRVAPGHKYGAWVIVKEAQVGVKGLKKQTCEVCKHEITEEIPAIEPEPTPTPTPGPNPGNPGLGIVIAIVVIAAAAAGYFFYTKKKNQK